MESSKLDVLTPSRDEVLKILRTQLGFRPWVLGVHMERRTVVELVSYPYFKEEGDEAPVVNVRTVPGDSTTLAYCPTSEIQTCESIVNLEVEREQVNKFIGLIAPYIRSPA